MADTPYLEQWPPATPAEQTRAVLHLSIEPALTRCGIDTAVLRPLNPDEVAWNPAAPRELTAPPAATVCETCDVFARRELALVPEQPLRDELVLVPAEPAAPNVPAVSDGSGTLPA